MSTSLRDQLVKAGLASRQKANLLGAKSRKKHQQPMAPGPGDAAARQAAKAKRDKDKTLNAALEEKRQKAAAKARIKALIEQRALPDYNGEVVYHYLSGGRVRQLFVRQSIHDQLASDELAITRLNGKIHLIPVAIAEKVLALNPAWALMRPGANRDQSGGGDDPYADYPVPDDLTW